MTIYIFTFTDDDQTVIIEKRLHDDDGNSLTEIEDAVTLGYNLAEDRGWHLKKVEQK